MVAEFGGIPFFTSPYIARDQMLILRPNRGVYLHPATTHALINGIPEREAHHTYNFWQALNPKLIELEMDAVGEWVEVR